MGRKKEHIKMARVKIPTQLLKAVRGNSRKAFWRLVADSLNIQVRPHLEFDKDSLKLPFPDECS